MVHKSRLLYSLALIFALISISIILIVIVNIRRYKEVVPYHDSNNYLKVNDNTEDVVGFQVTPDGQKVVYLTLKDSIVNVNITDGINASTKLASFDYKKGKDYEENAVNSNNQYELPPLTPFFTSSFRSENGNIYFRVRDLLEINSENQVKNYKQISDYLLYSDDELNNKTRSKLVKRIFERYSNEPIKVFYTGSVYVYLIDLDEGYYIESRDFPLKLERLPLSNETVESYVAAENETVQYGRRWDDQLNRMNEKAVIEKITHTLVTNTSFEEVVQTNSRDILLLGGKELKYTNEFKFTNNEFKGTLYEYCYKRFMPIDSSSCRGKRIFLRVNGNKYMILNNDPKYDSNKDLSTKYDSPFIYVPYDNRYITDNGLFFFLAQNHDLYVYDVNE